MSDHPAVREFRRAYLAGERPDAAAFVNGVPEAEQVEVQAGIRQVLAQEPPPDPAPETLKMVQAMLKGEQPLMVLRREKGLTRDAVVQGLTTDLGLASAQQPKVAEYYHELETGQLPLAGIRDRVFDALATVMGVARSSLMLKGPSPGDRSSGTFAYARSAPRESPVMLDAGIAPLRMGEPDEVDDLFTGGPG